MDGALKSLSDMDECSNGLAFTDISTLESLKEAIRAEILGSFGDESPGVNGKFYGNGFSDRSQDFDLSGCSDEPSNSRNETNNCSNKHPTSTTTTPTRAADEYRSGEDICGVDDECSTLDVNLSQVESGQPELKPQEQQPEDLVIPEGGVVIKPEARVDGSESEDSCEEVRRACFEQESYESSNVRGSDEIKVSKHLISSDSFTEVQSDVVMEETSTRQTTRDVTEDELRALMDAAFNDNQNHGSTEIKELQSDVTIEEYFQSRTDKEEYIDGELVSSATSTNTERTKSENVTDLLGARTEEYCEKLALEDGIAQDVDTIMNGRPNGVMEEAVEILIQDNKVEMKEDLTCVGDAKVESDAVKSKGKGILGFIKSKRHGRGVKHQVDQANLSSKESSGVAIVDDQKKMKTGKKWKPFGKKLDSLGGEDEKSNKEDIKSAEVKSQGSIFENGNETEASTVTHLVDNCTEIKTKEKKHWFTHGSIGFGYNLSTSEKKAADMEKISESKTESGNSVLNIDIQEPSFSAREADEKVECHSFDIGVEDNMDVSCKIIPNCNNSKISHEEINGDNECSGTESDVADSNTVASETAKKGSAPLDCGELSFFRSDICVGLSFDNTTIERTNAKPEEENISQIVCTESIKASGQSDQNTTSAEVVLPAGAKERRPFSFRFKFGKKGSKHEGMRFPGCETKTYEHTDFVIPGNTAFADYRASAEVVTVVVKSLETKLGEAEKNTRHILEEDIDLLKPSDILTKESGNIAKRHQHGPLQRFFTFSQKSNTFNTLPVEAVLKDTEVKAVGTKLHEGDEETKSVDYVTEIRAREHLSSDKNEVKARTPVKKRFSFAGFGFAKKRKANYITQSDVHKTSCKVSTEKTNGFSSVCCTTGDFVNHETQPVCDAVDYKNIADIEAVVCNGVVQSSILISAVPAQHSAALADMSCSRMVDLSVNVVEPVAEEDSMCLDGDKSAEQEEGRRVVDSQMFFQERGIMTKTPSCLTGQENGYYDEKVLIAETQANVLQITASSDSSDASALKSITLIPDKNGLHESADCKMTGMNIEVTTNSTHGPVAINDVDPKQSEAEKLDISGNAMPKPTGASSGLTKKSSFAIARGIFNKVFSLKSKPPTDAVSSDKLFPSSENLPIVADAKDTEHVQQENVDTTSMTFHHNEEEEEETVRYMMREDGLVYVEKLWVQKVKPIKPCNSSPTKPSDILPKKLYNISPTLATSIDETMVDCKNPDTLTTCSVVVAIDFGMTFSGFAYCFTSEGLSALQMLRCCGGCNTGSGKIPTMLLLDAVGEFHSFGFKAKKFYHDLDTVEASKWMYFEKFKTSIAGSSDLDTVHNENMIAASNGRTYPVISLVAHVLRFFKDQALVQLQATQPVQLSDIRWVIVVPSVWNDAAKQRMRKAAYKAGLGSKDYPDRLVLALEAESASLGVQNLSQSQLVLDRLSSRLMSLDTSSQYSLRELPAFSNCNVQQNASSAEGFLKPGTVYIVVNCGGAFVEVTVHEIIESATTLRVNLRELYRTTGGSYGSIGVDLMFESLLCDIFGPEVIQSFKLNRPAGWMDLMSSFESRKRSALPNNTTILNISLPFSFIDFHKKLLGTEAEAVIKMKGIEKNVRCSAQGMLGLMPAAISRLFQSTIDSIKTAIHGAAAAVENVEYLFLTGGFSESPMIQHAVRKEFSQQFNVVVPQEANLTSLKGAVLVGLGASVIVERRSRCSFGLGLVDRPKDSMQSSLNAESGEFHGCVGKFQSLISINESLMTSGSIKHRFAPLTEDQKTSKINIYSCDTDISTDCCYVTNDCVKHYATIRLDYAANQSEHREVILSLFVGGTEMKVKVKDLLTGKDVSSSIDFHK